MVGCDSIVQCKMYLQVFLMSIIVCSGLYVYTVTDTFCPLCDCMTDVDHTYVICDEYFPSSVMISKLVKDAPSFVLILNRPFRDYELSTKYVERLFDRVEFTYARDVVESSLSEEATTQIVESFEHSLSVYEQTSSLERSLSVYEQTTVIEGGRDIEMGHMVTEDVTVEMDRMGTEVVVTRGNDISDIVSRGYEYAGDYLETITIDTDLKKSAVEATSGLSSISKIATDVIQEDLNEPIGAISSLQPIASSPETTINMNTAFIVKARWCELATR